MNIVWEKIGPCPVCRSIKTCGGAYWSEMTELRIAAFCSDCAVELLASRNTNVRKESLEAWPMHVYETVKALWVVGPPHWMKKGIRISGAWQVDGAEVNASFNFRFADEKSIAYTPEGLKARYTCDLPAIHWHCGMIVG
jgi:hypothetical protein